MLGDRRNILSTLSEVVSFPELVDRGESLRQMVPRGGTAVITTNSSVTVAACLIGLEGWSSSVELRAGVAQAGAGGGEVFSSQFSTEGDELALARGITPGLTTQWKIYSSGTTGAPTATEHTLASLLPPTEPAAEGLRWGLIYSPTRMAGLQVLARYLTCRDDVVDVTDRVGTEAKVQALARAHVTALSATPTQWRQIMQSRSSSLLSLRQITLGGEIAPQGLLDTLRARFNARVTHVYASTEAGKVFSVSDGKEGFPATRVERGDIEVREGVLYVRNFDSSAAGPDGLVCTDDLVEIRGDRVIFLGRASGLVNVAGEKVLPEVVEQKIREHPLVADVAVTARRNRYSGSILVANVVLRDNLDLANLREVSAIIRSWVKSNLSGAHTPATVRIVDELSTTPTGKARRI